MSRFKEGERVRVRGDLCTPRHLWGHEATIEDVMQLAPGYLYNLRLDVPVRGRLEALAIFETWLEGASG